MEGRRGGGVEGNSPVTSDMRLMRFQQMLQVIVMRRSAAEEGVEETDAEAVICAIVEVPDECE